MSCICSYSWCWRCGQQRSNPMHEIFCHFGKDVWNVKFGWIFIFIFAPVSLFFIPFIVMLAMADELEYDSRFGKYLKVIFPLVFVFSPVIDVLMLVGLVVIIAEKPGKYLKSRFKFTWVVPYVICLALSAVLVFSGAVLAFFASFLGSLMGVTLLVFRLSSEKCGKKDYSTEFYPQNML